MTQISCFGTWFVLYAEIKTNIFMFKTLSSSFLIFVGAFLFHSCDSLTSKSKFANSERYDFANPKVLWLPQAFDEISGIAYYPKDTSIFAIIDEEGLLLKISLTNPKGYQKWTFDKKRDYEDLVLVDSMFYVLASDGDIITIKFKGDSLQTEHKKFKEFSDASNEFEVLYDNKDSQYLVIVCKDCDNEEKSEVKSFSYAYNATASPFGDFIKFNTKPINDKKGVENHLRASAAAINPVTKELYMISSIQKMITIFAKDGSFIKYIDLDPGIYKQPEGLAFTPEGDLIISNEFADEETANLLIMKNKLKK